MEKKTDLTDTLNLRRLKIGRLLVPIRGTAPLIPHKWSEKAKRQLPGHPEKSTVKKSVGAKNPEEEAAACLYLLDGKPAMPATAFKCAMVDACRFFDKPSMKEGKMLFRVIGYGPEQLVEIKGDKLLREDLPRNSGKTGAPDLRYRYQFDNWKARLEIDFIAERITDESIVALIEAGGHCGVGDWRPSSPRSNAGTFGTFCIDKSEEIQIENLDSE